MSHYTIADYVRIEESSHIKHEFIRGDIRVMPGAVEGDAIRGMSGGAIEHARMAIALGTMLTNQLQGRRCAVYSSDARVRVTANDAITYPDLVVCCGSVEQDVDDRLAIVNPIAIIEITSPSTEQYNRGEKLAGYKLIDSVRDIVIVGHRERSIEIHHRAPDGTWSVERAGAGGRAVIESIDCVIDVDAAYHDPLAAS